MLEVIELPPTRFSELPIILDPLTSVVVVAQDIDSKEIKGYWVGCAVIHIEPIALGPDIKGKTGLRMLQLLLSLLAEKGDDKFFAFSESDEVDGLLERMGMTMLPYKIFLGINPLLLLQDKEKEKECRT